MPPTRAPTFTALRGGATTGYVRATPTPVAAQGLACARPRPHRAREPRGRARSIGARVRHPKNSGWVREALHETLFLNGAARWRQAHRARDLNLDPKRAARRAARRRTRARALTVGARAASPPRRVLAAVAAADPDLGPDLDLDLDPGRAPPPPPSPPPPPAGAAAREPASSAAGAAAGPRRALAPRPECQVEGRKLDPGHRAARLGPLALIHGSRAPLT